jgi:hypothetical protein
MARRAVRVDCSVGAKDVVTLTVRGRGDGDDGWTRRRRSTKVGGVERDHRG